MRRALLLLFLVSCSFRMSTHPHVFVDDSLPDLHAVREGASWWAPAVDFELTELPHASVVAYADANYEDTISIVATGDVHSTCPWATVKASAPPVLAGITHTSATGGVVICLDTAQRLGDPRVPAHELGHALGLGHSPDVADLMHLTSRAHGVQCGDWRALADRMDTTVPRGC